VIATVHSPVDAEGLPITAGCRVVAREPFGKTGTVTTVYSVQAVHDELWLVFNGKPIKPLSSLRTDDPLRGITHNCSIL
jgi:hypothetical protein